MRNVVKPCWWASFGAICVLFSITFGNSIASDSPREALYKYMTDVHRLVMPTADAFAFDAPCGSSSTISSSDLHLEYNVVESGLEVPQKSLHLSLTGLNGSNEGAFIYVVADSEKAAILGFNQDNSYELSISNRLSKTHRIKLVTLLLVSGGQLVPVSRDVICFITK